MTGSRRPARSRAAKKSTRASGSQSPASGSATGTGRSGKFNAKGRHVDGVWCASAAEAERYEQLLRLAMVGAIDGLVAQPPAHDLMVNNTLICRYRADFRYDVVDDRGNVIRTVIEDVKGFETPDFRIKLELFNALVVPQLTLIKPGQVKGQRDLFMARHWDGALPPGPGEFKVPPEDADLHPGARKE